MKKIDTLTPEQVALFPVYVDKWLGIGLHCGPCDFEAAKDAAIRAYKEAGFDAPKKWYVADSPLSAAMMSCVLKDKNVSATAKNKLTQDDINPYLKTSKKYRTISPDAVDNSKSTKLKKVNWKKAKEYIKDQIFGSHDANWLAFYDYIKRELKIKECERLTPLMDLAEHCGWWVPYKEVCILQHRHEECHLEDGRLHCDDGPAIRYRDGFCVWSIKGVRVNEQIVMAPETQTLKQIKGEENAEIKRIRIERYGWPKYLTEINAEVLDMRKNEIEQTTESLMAAEDMRILVCACPSTARIYALEVPPETRTCKAAQDWLTGSDSGYCLGRS